MRNLGLHHFERWKSLGETSQYYSTLDIGRHSPETKQLCIRTFCHPSGETYLCVLINSISFSEKRSGSVYIGLCADLSKMKIFLIIRPQNYQKPLVHIRLVQQHRRFPKALETGW